MSQIGENERGMKELQSVNIVGESLKVASICSPFKGTHCPERSKSMGKELKPVPNSHGQTSHHFLNINN